MTLRIDLHTHSNASDGTTPPADLVVEARAAGLDVVALTDHDTTAGWDAAANALPAGLRLVRGAEISCVAEGISLHLLAYLFDPTYAPLADRLTALRDSRRARAQQMVALLAADGHPVDADLLPAEGTLGRPHVANVLIAAGLVTTIKQAFTPEWIGSHGQYWVPKVDFPVLEAIALVRAAGGVPVFAHPAATVRGKTVSDDTIRAMASAGLAGLEVDHVDHTDEARAHLRELASELDLLTTGSSDFHGTNKDIALGTNLTAEAALEQIATQATGVEVL